MDLLAPMIRWAIAPAWARWENSDYLGHYRTLKRTQFDSLAVIRQRQLEALKRLADHACRSSSFWRDRFNAVDLRPNDLSSFADFRRLPLLTKADLRAHTQSMLSTGVRKD